MDERIEEGFDVFVSDGKKAFGAVRQVRPEGRSAIVVYVEYAGDFVVPLSAVDSVHDEKVILNLAKLEYRMRRAIGHAHEHEDPNV